MKRKISFLVVAVLAIFPIFRASATPENKPDPNFFIYLCIGQSNMEAGAVPAEQDKDFNNPRFQFMAAVDMPKLGREMGKWYTAIPPICREGNNLGPVDFFGRKMIDILPSEYHVGVINVSVAGAKIQLWDREDYKDYIDNERDWMWRTSCPMTSSLKFDRPWSPRSQTASCWARCGRTAATRSPTPIGGGICWAGRPTGL